MRTCICRTCNKRYDEQKSRADYKGYCSQKCLHEMSHKLGYRKKDDKRSTTIVPNPYSEYAVLSRAKAVGSVYAN